MKPRYNNARVHCHSSVPGTVTQLVGGITTGKGRNHDAAFRHAGPARMAELVKQGLFVDHGVDPNGRHQYEITSKGRALLKQLE